MDLALTDEQRMIVDQVRRFVREDILPMEDKLDPDAESLIRMPTNWHRKTLSVCPARSRKWACTGLIRHPNTAARKSIL
jgi:alkylation response protein AidB-like acyl-CoA dehydrogenase